MKHQKREEDWATQVPSATWRGPFRDYGWERGQSVLPEFRDPDVNLTHDEREQLGARTGWSGSRMVGPHTGKGPRGYVRSDERIYEEVCERLTEHAQMDARDVSVQVQAGEVTLTGTVPDRPAKRLAEDLSESVYGVRDVHNRLHLQSERDDTPARWRDEVGHSGVYPASAAEDAPSDAQPQGEASWGQGRRGAQGYQDHGESELHIGRMDKQKDKP